MSMEESKYYVPSIDEFYAGFEFEFIPRNEQECVCRRKVSGSSLYYKGIFYPSSYRIITHNDSIRVKYLDKIDILDTGFEFIKENNGVEYFYYYSKTDVYQLTYSLDYIKITIKGISIDKNVDIFRGIIKNKSELKKILKMLCIA